jgi:uncharacterized protein (DUF58 family)
MLPRGTDSLRRQSQRESGQNVEVTEDPRQAVAERLRRRYPRSRVPRPLVLVLVGVGVALALSWLVVTAWQRARPPASAEIKAVQVVSDTKVEVTLSVERPNPSVVATCRLIAQAQDLGLVGEQAVSVPPSDQRRVDIVVSMTTLRRAVSTSVRGCTPT